MKQKAKLSKSQTMLASIATTERQQVVSQADQIYQARMNALFEDFGITFKDSPNLEQDGQDLVLTWEVPDAKPQLVEG